MRKKSKKINTTNCSIAGLMFVRHVGKHSILCAVVKKCAIPNLKNEHQHLITGEDNGNSVNLQIDCNISIDISEQSEAKTVNQLLTSPI